MENSWRIPRRTMLRGCGTALALPMLDLMLPTKLLTGSAFAEATQAGARKSAPNRMAFLYVPNGVNVSAWTPQAVGSAFELPPTLEPLKPFKDSLLVLSGLTQDKARPNGDGAGDHARAATSFLTGTQALKTSGTNIRAGVSVDQVAAERVGATTRFPSLEIGCERGGQSGDCDSGYSCAYSSNIAWKTPTTPVAKEVDPRLLFDRLFGAAPADSSTRGRARRERYRKSILDFVLEDASRLKGRLGKTDQRKLEEYLSSVREVEHRIQLSETAVEGPLGSVRPSGIPEDYREHLRLMADLLVLAFQTDLTRVSTYMFANEGSNRSYKQLEVPEGHHELSHHGGDKEKLAKIAKINRFHIEQVAYLLGKLKAVQEGEGTLLENCMIVFGSGIGDGNRHNHDELPILLAGRAGGTIETGRHIRYPQNTPLNNLFLSLLDRMEVGRPSLGDSTGRLKGLGTELGWF